MSKSEKNYSAIILAAGKSSRFGSFKPLEKIGNITFLEYLINVFKESGIFDIVIVSGHKSEEIKRKIDCKIVENKDYKTTKMIDSIKLGLENIVADKIFITPCDAIGFNNQTIEKLKNADADFAVPVFKGKMGHPVLVGKKIISLINNYKGNEGLDIIFKNRVTKIEVTDKNILNNLNTKKDYEDFLSSRFE